MGAWIEVRRRLRPSRIIVASLPSLGAWIEVLIPTGQSHQLLSLPSLGAWIEVCLSSEARLSNVRRSLHWERGLKYSKFFYYCVLYRRSLHWERGLKYGFFLHPVNGGGVAPFIGSVD